MSSSSSSGRRSENVKNNSVDDAKKTLNIEFADQALWLVKVPQFVAERWALAQNDEILGTMKVVTKPRTSSGMHNKPAEKILSVQLEKSDAYPDGPDQFSLDEVSQIGGSDAFMVFSKEPDDSFAIDGKVTKNLALRPQISNEYRKLIQKRGLAKIVTRRETLVADASEIELSETQIPTVEFITSHKGERKRKAAAEKAQAANKRLSSSISSGGTVSSIAGGELNLEELKEKIFDAFEVKERLLFKDLVAFCSDVPGFTKEKDVRDLLEEYAVYNRRGPYKQYWELKPEYRDNFSSHKANDEDGADTAATESKN